ncbi:hypothetical protein PSQ40_04675 [Curvibacter sp. HBC61]|uniref:Uncharacterized protein n=1 Tax=Curvibacter cyanobacteriorum TaxID=3026422 RepID=A0ABT5MUX6_9BURK|nr:hypothetical protein [Curvibacter sp. HBC61]MDD0837859.1 hypothetical protein [Curvibacter sp. HBC61]
MSTENQPEALRLAAWLEQSALPYDPTDVKECAAELRRLQAENEGLRARVARSDTPTGLQPAAILPAFIGTPKRKLNELLAQGFQVNGLQIERDVDGAEPVRGFITVGGLVGWWNPDTQAERDRLREQVETTLTMVEQSNKISAELLRERDDLRAQVEALSKPQEPVQWQKRHQEQTEGLWENTTHHDAKWWEGNSTGWEIRALYAHPTPAPTRPAVQTPTEAAVSLGIKSAIHRIRSGASESALDPLEYALRLLAAAPQAEAPTPPAPWSIAFDAWWADNRVATHKVHSAEGLARKAFHAGSIKGQKGGA